MRTIKSYFAAGVFLLFFISLPAFGDYRTTAMNLINRAAALGPPAGMNLLISTNWRSGARGCAVKEAVKNPASAATIMIAIAQRLIVFANTTTERRPQENSRDPIQPRRYEYWMAALHQLDLADRFLNTLSKTNPTQAANLAIQIATIYYNSIPTNPNYRQIQNNYRAKARYHLYDLNIYSARGYARKIKNKANQNALLTRIKGLYRTWNL